MSDNAQLIEEMRWQLKQIEDRKAMPDRLKEAEAARDSKTREIYR